MSIEINGLNSGKISKIGLLKCIIIKSGFMVNYN